MGMDQADFALFTDEIFPTIKRYVDRNSQALSDRSGQLELDASALAARVDNLEGQVRALLELATAPGSPAALRAIAGGKS